MQILVLTCILGRCGEKTVKALLVTEGYLVTVFELLVKAIACFGSLRKLGFISSILNDAKGTQKSVDEFSVFVLTLSIETK